MNIIQIQDRLKGLPEDALINYVKNPMGEVPIYLALGEMQRRKDMKARFDANKPEEPSIAEQLVAEAEPMQMGLGAMAPQQMMPEGQGVGAPQPAPEMDPRQMAASGIAANPQSAVGGTAMMKEGGIVGYAPGGDVQYSDEFIKMLEEQARLNQGTGGPYGGSIAPDYRFRQENMLPKSAKTQISKDNPYSQYNQYGKNFGVGSVEQGTFVPFGQDAYSSDLYGNFNPSNIQPRNQLDYETDGLSNREAEAILKDEKSEAAKEKEIKENQGRLNKITGNNKKVITDAEKLEAERLEAERLKKINDANNNNAGKKDDLAGLLSMEEIFAPYRRSVEEAKAEDKRLKEAYGINTDFYESGTNDNINMSLIQAGLAIAGGTSANPLENISKGALPALESFNKEKARLSGANRLENLQDLDNYREDQDKLRAYAIDLYGKNALRDAETAKLNSTFMEKAKKEAQDFMNGLYGTGMAGTFFSTPLGKRKYSELRNKKAVKSLKEYTDNKISGEIIEVFVPYIDASGNESQINLASKEDLGNLSQDQIKYMNDYKN